LQLGGGILFCRKLTAGEQEDGSKDRYSQLSGSFMKNVLGRSELSKVHGDKKALRVWLVNVFGMSK
jgi:hypothetical protein